MRFFKIKIKFLNDIAIEKIVKNHENKKSIEKKLNSIDIAVEL